MNIQSVRQNECKTNHAINLNNQIKNSGFVSKTSFTSPLKNDSVCFKSKNLPPKIDVSNTTVMAKIQFLSHLEDYEGTFFVRDGKKPNTLFMRVFDVPAFLEERKPDINKRATQDYTNDLIEDFVNPDRGEQEDYEREEYEDEFGPDKTYEEAMKEVNDSYDDMFDKDGAFQIENFNHLFMKALQPNEKNSTADSNSKNYENVSNYVTKFIDKEYGAVMKIELPELNDEIMSEIKYDLNEAQLESTNKALTNWLIKQKNDADNMILNPNAN